MMAKPTATHDYTLTSGSLLETEPDPSYSEHAHLHKPRLPWQRLGHWCYALLADTWLVEYLCIIASVVLLGTVITLVAYFNGRPLSAWTASLTFNTILSILSTPLKGTIIYPTASALGQLKWVAPNGWMRLKTFKRYDEASRGPVGALVLLLTSGRRPLAAVGASIVVAALFVDAFIQASMGIRSRTVAHSDEASIPVFHNYSAYTLQPYSQGNTTYEVISPEVSMQSSLYAAIINSVSQPDALSIQPVCPTGNCQFAAYSSIAMRSSCQDLTSDIHWKHTGSGLLEGQQYPFYKASLNTIGNSSLTLQLTNTTTPYLNFSATTDTSDTDSFKSRTVPMLDLYGLMYNTTGTFFWWEWQRMKAFRCNLDLILSQHNTSIVNGSFIDKTVSTSDRWQSNGSYFHIPLLSGEAGGISSFALIGLQDLLSTALEGDGSSDTTSYTQTPGSIPVTWTNEYLNAFYTNGVGYINETLAGIAHGLTTSLRSKSGQHVLGSVLERESHFHARLEFSVMPALLVIVTGLFILVTSLRSYMTKTPTWKSNVLATIVGTRRLIDRAGTPAVDLPEVQRVSEVEAWARGRKILLEDEKTQSR